MRPPIATSSFLWCHACLNGLVRCLGLQTIKSQVSLMSWRVGRGGRGGRGRRQEVEEGLCTCQQRRQFRSFFSSAQFIFHFMQLKSMVANNSAKRDFFAQELSISPWTPERERTASSSGRLHKAIILTPILKLEFELWTIISVGVGHFHELCEVLGGIFSVTSSSHTRGFQGFKSHLRIPLRYLYPTSDIDVFINIIVIVWLM